MLSGQGASARGNCPYHDKEAHSDGLADLDEFTLVGWTDIPVSQRRSVVKRNHGSHTLGASLDEQRTVADKVLGDIGELLEVVGHYDGDSRDRDGGYYKRRRRRVN